MLGHVGGSRYCRCGSVDVPLAMAGPRGKDGMRIFHCTPTYAGMRSPCKPVFSKLLEEIQPGTTKRHVQAVRTSLLSFHYVVRKFFVLRKKALASLDISDPLALNRQSRKPLGQRIGGAPIQLFPFRAVRHSTALDWRVCSSIKFFLVQLCLRMSAVRGELYAEQGQPLG
jgi:hypothetical protein